MEPPLPAQKPPSGPSARRDDAALTSKRALIVAWGFGLLCFFGFVVVVLHLGEVTEFTSLAEAARPEWLLLALLAQTATYGCEAAVWHVATLRAGHARSWASLLPLSVAKLFTDQAMPSGGIGGALLMMEGLRRRGLPGPAAMAVMLAAMVSAFAAYITATLGGLAVLAWYHHADPAALGATAVLTLISIAIPASVLLLRRWRDRLRAVRLLQSRGMTALLDTLAEAPTDLLRDPGLLLRTWALQGMIFLLDALTLWLIFRAVGQELGFWVAYAGLVTASAAATVAPMPGGLGAFEAGSVAMLTLLGVPLESAAAGTLLLRGMTFWLPMVPGLWLARREIRSEVTP